MIPCPSCGSDKPRVREPIPDEPGRVQSIRIGGDGYCRDTYHTEDAVPAFGTRQPPHHETCALCPADATVRVYVSGLVGAMAALCEKHDGAEVTLPWGVKTGA